MVDFAKYKDILFVDKPRAATSGDGFNQVDLSDDDNWIELFNRRASVEPSNGREFIVGQQVNSETTHVIKMRHDAETKTIVPTYRLRIGTGVSRRVFGIVGRINVNEAERELQFPCVEKVA